MFLAKKLDQKSFQLQQDLDNMLCHHIQQGFFSYTYTYKKGWQLPIFLEFINVPKSFFLICQHYYLRLKESITAFFK
jgi:hypothetical protein